MVNKISLPFGKRFIAKGFLEGVGGPAVLGAEGQKKECDLPAK